MRDAKEWVKLLESQIYSGQKVDELLLRALTEARREAYLDTEQIAVGYSQHGIAIAAAIAARRKELCGE